MLSQQLPQTVDTMSPNGALQEPEESQDSSSGGSLADQAGLGSVGR
jgi:uncharacterized protein YidB (DUF937 family)